LALVVETKIAPVIFRLKFIEVDQAEFARAPWLASGQRAGANSKWKAVSQVSNRWFGRFVSLSSMR